MNRHLASFALALMSLTVAVPAWACGGFFCNFQNPVNQAAERILYIQQGGDVTAHIQIRYQGAADQFSWVLPLQKVPKLGIGSDSVFTALEQSTRPQYQLQVQYKPDCYYGCQYAPTAGGTQDAQAASDTSKGGVVVLAEETVGPYDTVVIKGDTGAELQKWLTDNGFQQPKGSDVLLDSYAKKGFVFLGLKLQKNKQAGDLAPIVVTIAEVGPCLPIRLTAIAAEPDMPIIAWVLAEHRAIPKNYLHVEINDKTVDWQTNGGNYLSVASKAVDQASGHAFLTEFAGKSNKLAGQFSQPGWNTAELAKIKEPGPFLNAMLSQNLPRTSQVIALIKKFVPKLKGFESMSDQEYYGCVQSSCTQCGGSCASIKDALPMVAFDPAAFAKALEEGVVKPLADLQKAFDTVPYLTRLFTTLSAEEMTKDPIFALNGGLPDVSNLHTAQAVPMCEAGSNQAKTLEITYADGTKLTVPAPDQNQGCFFPGGGQGGDGKGKILTQGGQPAKVVSVLDETGAPLVIDPTVADKVDAQLNAAELGKPSLTEAFKNSLPPVTWNANPPVGSDIGSGSDASSAEVSPGPGSPETIDNQDGGNLTDAVTKPTPVPAGSSSSSGCTASPTANSAGVLSFLLALVALVGIRRRTAA